MRPADGALHVLFAHGIGEQESDYAVKAAEWFGDACRDRDLRLYSVSNHWAPLADGLEQQFLSRIEAAGSQGNLSQRLAIGTLADALVYRSSPELREQIFQRLDSDIVWLRGDHVLVFAHSLGGLILTDYLRARPRVRNVTLVTMGCNIGLFTLGRRFEHVPQLMAPGSWLNVFYPGDMLGYPLGVDPTLSHVRDVKLHSSRWLFRGLSHTDYWGDKRLWAKVLPRLLGL